MSKCCRVKEECEITSTFSTKAGLRSKLWTPGQIINILVMNPDQPLEYTNLKLYKLEGRIPLEKLDIDIEMECDTDIEEGNLLKVIKNIVLTRFAPYINLEFRFTNDLPPDQTHPLSQIRIFFDPNFNGSLNGSSKIGNDSETMGYTKPSMTIYKFSIQTFMHEFCHALGMVHTHQDDSECNPIIWNVQAVLEQVKGDESRAQNNYFGRKGDVGYMFDRESIMTYQIVDCMVSIPKPDVDPRTPFQKGVTSKNYKLSPGDVYSLQMFYPGGRAIPWNVWWKNTFKVDPPALNPACINPLILKNESSNLYKEEYTSRRDNSKLPIILIFLLIILILFIFLI